jgi:hypothetical protein
MVSKIMKKSIAVITFSLFFLMSCLSNSFNQPVNTYPSTIDISALQTSAVQTVYATAMAFDTPTETSTHLPTLTSTGISNATPTIIPILMHSDVLGKNCSAEYNYLTSEIDHATSEIDYDLNATLLNMVTQLPPDIITPPPGINFDGGIFSSGSIHFEGTCHFISIPRKSTHGYSGYTFWNGKSNIIYWTEGYQTMGGDQLIYGNNGGWYWLKLLTLTKEKEIQMLTPEYLRPTSTITFDYPSYQTAVNQTFSAYMTYTKNSTPTPPIIP